MTFPQEKEDIIYTLISSNMHEGNTMSSGHDYCEIIYFNTWIWWSCDDDNITQLITLPYNVYSNVSD